MWCYGWVILSTRELNAALTKGRLSPARSLDGLHVFVFTLDSD